MTTKHILQSAGQVLPLPRVSFKSGALMLAVSAFIAICAQIQLPIGPVPMTMQPFAIYLIGLMMPWRVAAGGTILYVMEAAFGLPVLAGLKGGLMPLMGVTSGYIFGFVLSATSTAFVLEKLGPNSIFNKTIALTVGIFLLYAAGLSVLSSFVGWDKALLLGFYPFIGCAVAKCGLAIALSTTLERFRGVFRS